MKNNQKRKNKIATNRQGAVLMTNNPKNNIIFALFCVAFFYLICLCATSKLEELLLFLIPITLGVCIFRFKTLKMRFSILTFSVIIWVFANGISTLYSLSGKFAFNEFLKVSVSFCVFLLILSLAREEKQIIGKYEAGIIATVSALIGLISIDLISTRFISTAFLGVLGSSMVFFTDHPGVEKGVRIISMLVESNVFAACMGIGTLLALGLASIEDNKRKRNFYLTIFFINALAFLLAFSMGASAIIFLSFLVYIFISPKDKRGQVFVLMIETLVLTLVFASIISKTSFDAWDGFDIVPIICVIAGSILLCLVDRIFYSHASRISAKNAFILIGSSLSVLAIFCILAFSITGSVKLEKGEILRRAAYIDAGEYILSIDSDADVMIEIESQSIQDTMMHTSENIYSGDADGAYFVVPKDSKVVFFNMEAKNDTHINSLEYSIVTHESKDDTGISKVPLGYKLLPGFVANRIQGIFANENAIQRTVFFDDGIKLFKRSPVFGLGMGSYENSIKNVQTFFYATKYAHNHYIQTLVEIGIVGLLIFASVLVLSALAIWRSRHAHPLVPALAGCLVFIIGHVAVETDLSFYASMIFFYAVFALISLVCGSAIHKPKLNVKRLFFIVPSIITCVIMIGFFCLLSGNVLAKSLVEHEPGFDSLESAIKLDRYEWADYMLLYVLNSVESNDKEIKAKAEEYAGRLEQLNSNAIPCYLAEYYFATARVSKGFEMAERYVKYNASDSEAWQMMIDIIMGYEEENDEYRAGVKDIAQLMKDWNDQNMGSISLDERAMDFILEGGI